MDDYFEWVVGVLVAFMLVCGGYGLYKLGKWQERRDYTLAFIQATTDTYNEAYADGEKLGREEGIKIGYQKCLMEDMGQRDRY